MHVYRVLSFAKNPEASNVVHLKTMIEHLLFCMDSERLYSYDERVLQKNEEDLLNKVDEYCNEYFLKRLREPSHVIGHTGITTDQGDTIGRIENLQAYLLQLQESQTLVAQQMTEVANHYAQLVNPPTTPPSP